MWRPKFWSKKSLFDGLLLGTNGAKNSIFQSLNVSNLSLSQLLLHLPLPQPAPPPQLLLVPPLPETKILDPEKLSTKTTPKRDFLGKESVYYVENDPRPIKHEFFSPFTLKIGLEPVKKHLKKTANTSRSILCLIPHKNWKNALRKD